jgi:guanylate kinase
MAKGDLIIISGPSGAGKGTLVRGLLARVPRLWCSVSATTRPPRPGEREGVDYFFLTPEEFERREREGEFLETAEVHGNRYGTLRGPVQDKIAEGCRVILEIDPQGAMQVRRNAAESTLVFVRAPSEDELRRRLAKRGSETPSQVETRMRTAERELQLVNNYDFVVINDDVRRATDELARIVESLPTKEQDPDGHRA